MLEHNSLTFAEQQRVQEGAQFSQKLRHAGESSLNTNFFFNILKDRQYDHMCSVSFDLKGLGTTVMSS